MKTPKVFFSTSIVLDSQISSQVTTIESTPPWEYSFVDFREKEHNFTFAQISGWFVFFHIDWNKICSIKINHTLQLQTYKLEWCFFFWIPLFRGRIQIKLPNLSYCLGWWNEGDNFCSFDTLHYFFSPCHYKTNEIMQDELKSRLFNLFYHSLDNQLKSSNLPIKLISVQIFIYA